MSRNRKAATTLAALLLTISPLSRAHAQDIMLAGGGADPVWTGAANSSAGFSLDQGSLSSDSRRDLIIGAIGNATTSGRVYVLFGGPVFTGQLSLSTANVIISGASAGDQFGFATANGPVFSLESTAVRDLIVGAPESDGGAGRVYLFHSPFSEGQRLTTANARLTIVGAPGDHLGVALAAADLNNDGYRDIVIGTRSGKIYIINGSATLSGTLNLPTDATATLTGAGIGEQLEAGDVTGDHVYDLLIGNPGQNVVYMVAGRNAGYFGPLTIESVTTATYSGINPGDRAGTSIRSADIDGDGVRDIIIGAPYADGPGNTRPDSGSVYIIWGGGAAQSNRTLDHADVTIYGTSAGSLAGIYVATGGINRDSNDDLVLSAPLGAGGAGQLMVLYGHRRSQMPTTIDLAVAGNIDRNVIGDVSIGAIRSAAVYEVTGEGARDVIVGIPTASSNAGQVYFALSPRLSPATRTVSWHISEGGSATTAVPINNPSVVALTWASSTSTPWVNATPANGTSVRGNPGTLQLASIADTMAPGSYTGSVTVTSTSIHLEMTSSISVSLTIDQTRYMGIDAPANGSSPTQPFALNGWAIDTAAASGTGVDRVDIWAYPAVGSGYLLGTATYGLSRPDIAATYGSRFQNSGFQGTFSGLGTGTYTIVARAHSPASNQSWSKAQINVTTQGVPAIWDDLDGDGKTDFLWQDSAQGYLAVWRFNNGRVIGGLPLSINREPDLNWKIVGTGDFNNDGHPDFVWRNMSSGQMRIWYMNGATVLGTAMIDQFTSDMTWRVIGVADIDGDGNADILWQSTTQGWITGWRMVGPHVAGPLTFSVNRVPDTNWQIQAVGDFDGDGHPDFLWRHQVNGLLAVWRLDGTTLSGGIPLSVNQLADMNWKIVGAGDMDGDGRADIIWRYTDGTLAIWCINGGTIRGVPLTPNRIDPNWILVAPR